MFLHFDFGDRDRVQLQESKVGHTSTIDNCDFHFETNTFCNLRQTYFVTSDKYILTLETGTVCSYRKAKWGTHQLLITSQRLLLPGHKFAGYCQE